jgi:hypothetical protein
MPVELRYASFDDYPRISRFLAAHWAADHVYVREPRLFDWTFGRRGLWDSDGYSFALAEDGPEVVGILGAIPFVLNRFGQTSRALWLAQYMLNPDYRRGSLAVQLLRMMRREPYQATIAFGINPRTAPIYQVLRWRVLENIPRHFAVLPGAVARATDLIHLTHQDWPRERAAALAESFKLPSPGERQIAAGAELPDDWDEASWPHFAQHSIVAARDAAYLKWRYLDHPLFAYRSIVVAEGGRAGLLVWRLETIRHVTEQGEQALDRIGRMVEFLPTSPANARDLLAAFFQQLTGADAVGADFYGYHGATRGWLSENGMTPTEVHPDGGAIPARFQPLDGKSSAIMSSMFIAGEAPPCSAAPDCPWYWTKSDADQDRPN